MPNRSSRSAVPPREPAADEAETEMGGNRSAETSEDAFKSNPAKGATSGNGKPTERWKQAQDVEHEEGVPKTRSRRQGGPAAAMPENRKK